MGEKLLWKKYKDYFPVGAAISYDKISRYDKLLDNFNSISAENEFKFERIHPEEDVYDFEKSDIIVEYALKKGKQLRGHTFVWHNQNPEWLFLPQNCQREKMLKILESHIGTVMDRYRDSVRYWDVVNEIFDDSDDAVLRKTQWSEIIGADYVERAFCIAHEANPNAELYINEYNLEIPGKLDRALSYLEELKKKEIPVTGLGIQGHYSIFFPGMDMIKAMFEKLAKLDMKIQITELDVSVFQFQDERKDILTPTDEMLSRQAEYYRNVFSILKEYSEIISGVTLWGVADDYTWLDDYPVVGRKNWPLLFDETFRAKKAFNAIMEI